MKITEYAITKKTVSYFFVLVLVGGGLWSYQNLGKLEFPTFTIKTALVSTPYPGASAGEVEQEVTERLEKAIQQMSQVKHIRSISRPGVSIIYVDVKNQYDTQAIPQIWDELRRKVGDSQPFLPPGAGPSLVNDDFGDVYGVFFALTGEGFSYEELRQTAELLKRELLPVKGVASVELWGDRQEAIYLEFSPSRMAELGMSPKAMLQTLNSQNRVADGGRALIQSDYIRIDPSGAFQSVEDLGDLLLGTDETGNLIRLRDLVKVRRGFKDPPRWMLRFDGKPGIGLGISTEEGGNVVEMGREIQKRISELMSQVPVGMELQTISYQSELVKRSVQVFLVNLVEAVAIVIAVLCITMGLSSGILMGVILLLTILGTFIGMQILSVDFQMISLGALILALGMLVDNAIVVTEGILVRVRQGVDRRKAALQTVSQTAWPLLGATLVAVLAFAAIGTSKDTTGEFLMSLFLVMALSLGLSWALAISLTPLFCVQFLRGGAPGEAEDPYRGRVYRFYRRILDACLRRRVLSLLFLLGTLALALVGFTQVEESLFPHDSRNQFLINYWRPEGTHIKKVSEDLKVLEGHLASLSEVSHTATFVGQGALRFVLTYEPEMPDSSYGQILVTVKDRRSIDGLMMELRGYVAQHFPDAQVELKKFRRGPGAGAQIQARFIGPDIVELRRLANKAQAVMAADPLATDVRVDWRQPSPLLRPKVSETAARRLGVTRSLVADAVAMNFSGKTVGVYREKDQLIPIVLRANSRNRKALTQVEDVVVGTTGGVAVPLRRVVTRMEAAWDTPIIHRRDRRRTITVGCNPVSGTEDTLLGRLRPRIESIPLPEGYSLEWGGDHESSTDAKRGLFQMVPVFFLAMVLIVVAMFNSARQTVIIFLCLPLVSIGVTAGLLLTGLPFGFMCILGYLGLSGMIIKNAVVLLDQVRLEIRSGKEPYEALLDAAVSRLRPVTMAALTTVLGMIPLLGDIFFVGMSVTIIGGLTFGTVLTLVVVPLLYTLFFRVRPGDAPARTEPPVGLEVSS